MKSVAPHSPSTRPVKRLALKQPAKRRIANKSSHRCHHAVHHRSQRSFAAAVVNDVQPDQAAPVSAAYPSRYVESLLKNPDQFREQARSSTSKLFEQLLTHIDAQPRPTHALLVPEMEPFVIKDMPLAVTITSCQSFDSQIPDHTLFLPAANYAVLVSVCREILALGPMGPRTSSNDGKGDLADRYFLNDDVTRREQLTETMRVLDDAAFNFRHPDPHQKMFLQFVGTSGTGKSLLSWIIFLFCVANDINCGVTYSDERLLYVANDKKFTILDFDDGNPTRAGLYKIAQFADQPFVNLFDLRDGARVSGHISLGKDIEFNSNLALDFIPGKAFRKQIAISFFSTQNEIKIGTDFTEVFREQELNLFFMYNPPSWHTMRSFVNCLRLDGDLLPETLDVEGSSPFLWSSMEPSPVLPTTLTTAVAVAGVDDGGQGRSDCSDNHFDSLFSFYVPTQCGILRWQRDIKQTKRSIDYWGPYRTFIYSNYSRVRPQVITSSLPSSPDFLKGFQRDVFAEFLASSTKGHLLSGAKLFLPIQHQGQLLHITRFIEFSIDTLTSRLKMHTFTSNGSVHVDKTTLKNSCYDLIRADKYDTPNSTDDSTSIRYTLVRQENDFIAFPSNDDQNLAPVVCFQCITPPVRDETYNITQLKRNAFNGARAVMKKLGKSNLNLKFMLVTNSAEGVKVTGNAKNQNQVIVITKHPIHQLEQDRM